MPMVDDSVLFPAYSTFDLVIALDCSAGMEEQIRCFVQGWDAFLEKIRDRAEDSGFYNPQIRVKVITFSGSPHIKQSPFFSLPEQGQFLKRYFQSITVAEPCECSHSLEALYLAMNSAWREERFKVRHCILLITDKPPSMGGKVNSAIDFPQTFDAYTEALDDSRYHNKTKLIAVCPMVSYFEQMQGWGNTWSSFGSWDQFEEIDIDMWFDFIFHV